MVSLVARREQLGPDVPREGFLGVGQRAGDCAAALDDADAIAFAQKGRDRVRVGDVIGELLVVVLDRGRDELVDVLGSAIAGSC